MTSHLSFRKGLTPEGYARELHYRLQIKDFPISLEHVCRQLGIRLKEDDLGAGVDGCLIRTEKRVGILTNRNIRYEPRKRFTIAHELGHHEIPWHDAEQYWSTSKTIEGFYCDDQHEREANQFASEFLFPEVEAKRVLRSKEVSMQLVREMSERFGMSLTAVALKLVKACPDTCALFYSVDNKIVWSVASNSLRRRSELRVGTLQRQTYAADVFLGQVIPDQRKPVGPTGWLASGYANLVEVFEHSIPFPELNAVLTLVTVPASDTEEDEDLSEDDW